MSKINSIKKLTNKQINELRAFKGQVNGSEKFFDYIANVYKDNEELTEKIKQCREMSKAADEVGEALPSAQSKAINMFYKWMDELNKMIGYTAD